MAALLTDSKRRWSKFNVPTRLFPWKRKSKTDQHICARCSELPLGKAFDEDIPPLADASRSLYHEWSRLDVKIADVGQYYREPSDPDCDLCHMLSASRIRLDELAGLENFYSLHYSRDQDPDHTDELHAFDLRSDLPWVDMNGKLSSRTELLEGLDSRYLAVVPSGAVGGERMHLKAMRMRGETKGFLILRRLDSRLPDIFHPQAVTAQFDLAVANNWFQFCQHNHRRLCAANDTPTAGLRLIDCHHRVVKPAPVQARYTALSYVWGLAATDNATSTDRVVNQDQSDETALPSELPAVIADAVKVTTDMGLQYLWVDKFCIDQADTEAKHDQIQQMDSIYENAELTIVAAAGEGPSYGLPGIGHRLRSTLQTTATIDDIEIILAKRNPQIAIKTSKWSQRAWTFQEAVLSRRRLVFTDDQVYFECRGMNCNESLSSSLDKLHEEDKSKFRDVMMAGIFGRNEKQKYGLFDEGKLSLSAAYNFIRFQGMIEQYSARGLTFDADSISAFAGIIRKFETSYTGVDQIWGVPFRSDMTGKGLQASFTDGLAWNHKALSDEETKRPKRRQEFPSWSWTGWAGEVQYIKRWNQGPNPQLFHSSVKSISLEHGDGSIRNFSDVVDAAQIGRKRPLIPSVIRIVAPLFPSSAFSCDNSTSPPSLEVLGFSMKLALSIGPWDPSGFCASLRDRNHRQCIYLGGSYRASFIMVLQSSNNGWTRVGMVFGPDDSFMSRSDLKQSWSSMELEMDVHWEGSDFDEWKKQRWHETFRII